jgi:hypothetical protein
MNRAWITWTGLAVVALAAAVLSFDALRQLAVLAGTPATLAWLLPVTIDAAALVATRVWLAGKSAPGAHFARFLALGMIGLSVAGNGISHWLSAFGIAPAWWAVVAVAAVPPAVLGAVAHLAALAVTRQRPAPAVFPVPHAGGGEHGNATDPAVEPAPTAEVLRVDPEKGARLGGTPPGDSLVDQARYLVAAGEAEGRKVGRASLARQLGCTEHQARQVLRQLDAEKRPALRVAGGEHQ